ncbi:MAG TPA: hypothetical protein VKV21_02620 [Solirubrobacteraceae bacterium]|nr:hypothetical protein [Solirubrobacteraceae bacterium]
MTESSLTGSPRLALAEVAERVVARMPGVALTRCADARCQTVGRDRRIRGITTVAQGDGRYELALHVVVAWPPGPLTRLAEELRRRVLASAKRAQLEDRLGEVHVEIVSIDDPEPTADSLAPGRLTTGGAA